MTNAILDFNKLNDNASYIGYGFENPVLTFDELLPIVEKGIVNASRVFESEQEIILKNRKLVLPKESQLFFIRKDEIGRTSTSNQLELIKKYDLSSFEVFFLGIYTFSYYTFHTGGLSGFASDLNFILSYT